MEAFGSRPYIPSRHPFSRSTLTNSHGVASADFPMQTTTPRALDTSALSTPRGYLGPEPHSASKSADTASAAFRERFSSPRRCDISGYIKHVKNHTTAPDPARWVRMGIGARTFTSHTPPGIARPHEDSGYTRQQGVAFFDGYPSAPVPAPAAPVHIATMKVQQPSGFALNWKETDLSPRGPHDPSRFTSTAVAELPEPPRPESHQPRFGTVGSTRSSGYTHATLAGIGLNVKQPATGPATAMHPTQVRLEKLRDPYVQKATTTPGTRASFDRVPREFNIRAGLVKKGH